MSRWIARLMIAIRIFLAFVFIAYGAAKLFGGQFYYGDWSATRSTIGGPSFVWYFYGYSPFYGRVIGLFELVPAIMLLIPRTAAAGAAALFAVSLNVAIMDFAFNFPGVKYAAAFYTFLCVVLIAYDSRKLGLLLLSQGEAAAAFDAAMRYRSAPRERAPAIGRRALIVGAVILIPVLIALADVVIVSRDLGPRAESLAALVERGMKASDLKMTRLRMTGSYGTRTALADYQLIGSDPSKIFRVESTRPHGFTGWRVIKISELSPSDSSAVVRPR
ncbi:MAG: DoxX family membrane protein [Gemmatimonadota bacterium]|nr:DoxX family membrane protein [Gemmatimonadota bacterium]